jgi:aspartate/methionine/tyrosine aminotransferase
MNFGPPEWVKNGASIALQDISANHYSHPKRRIRLREAIRDFYGPAFQRELDADTEILVTSGANEGRPQFSKSPTRNSNLLQVNTLCGLRFWNQEMK